MSLPRSLVLLLTTCAISLLGACGGGGGGGSSSVSSASQTPDFYLSVSPATVQISSGATQTATVGVTALNSFNGSVAVTLTGAPSGLSASPASFNLSAGAQQTVTLTAGPNLSTGAANLTISGAANGITHSFALSLQTFAAVASAHPPVRTRYLKTGSFYDPNSLQYAPPRFTVYDQQHRQFFVSNPYLNRIDVFDANTELQSGTIPVPMAWGLDLSPVGNKLWAGTLFGDLYQIDTSTLQIQTRFPAASIGPTGFAATAALVLADGKLALLGGQGGILGVDGAGDAAIWDPLSNALVDHIGITAHIGSFVLNGDRTRVLMTDVDSDGNFCSYDPANGQSVFGSVPFDFVREIIPTPDGSRFFLTTNQHGVKAYDARTLAPLGQLPPPTNPGIQEIPNAVTSGVMSLDGNTLYLIDQTTAAIGAYDTHSFAQRGWLPTFFIEDLQDHAVIAAIDETGLMAGPIGHGVAFLDSKPLLAAQPAFFRASSASAYTGPLSGGTLVTSVAAAFSTSGTTSLGSVYIGNIAASAAQLQTSNGSVSLDITTPPSAIGGAVDILPSLSDGSIGLLPEFFSYGPSITVLSSNAATADPGSFGALHGYGLGQSQSGPQVSIGGQNAPTAILHPVPPLHPYPFAVGTLQFAVPPGPVGSAQDVTLSTPNGSTVLRNAFHYVPSLLRFPGSASLQSGIYDASRGVYYFADQRQIQVLDPARGWQAAIPLPTIATSNLSALSLSPDASKLAVSDFGGQFIYLVDLSGGSPTKAFPMPIDYINVSRLGPAGLAITSTGNIYFAAADISGTGTPLYYKLVTSTGAITTIGTFFGNQVQATGAGDKYTRMLLSPDESKVFSTADGQISLYIDTSDDTIHFAFVDGLPYTDDAAISADSSTVYQGGYFFDSNLNVESTLAYADEETWLASPVIGSKLSQNGSLLYQPNVDSLDIFSRNSGRLLYRVQLPVNMSAVFDPLVQGPPNTFAIITSSGVALLDTSSLPIPSSLTVPFAASAESLDRTTTKQPVKRRPVSARLRPTFSR